VCGKIMFITEAMARPDIYEPPLPWTSISWKISSFIYLNSMCSIE
jgi:hypothetical protein